MWRDTIDMTDGESAPMRDTITDCTPAELQHVMGVNLFAPIYLSRAFARHWLGLPTKVDPNAKAQMLDKADLKKKILFISSISGIVNMTPQRQVAYNASKGGLTMAAKVKLPPLLMNRQHTDTFRRSRASGLVMVLPSTPSVPDTCKPTCSRTLLLEKDPNGARYGRT